MAEKRFPRTWIVNDWLTTIPNTRTWWHDICDWTNGHFIGGDYSILAAVVEQAYACCPMGEKPEVIVRNASYFRPIRLPVPTVSMLQDINLAGPVREMQDLVLQMSDIVVFNNPFTASKYQDVHPARLRPVPLGVDFTRFTPDGETDPTIPPDSVIWVGASRGAEGPYKGFSLFENIVRTNPDVSFVGVFKDEAPPFIPSNLRAYVRLGGDAVARLMRSCRIGLCTSRVDGSPVENQHIAGVEMGATGLRMVAPQVGNYWHRKDDMPGTVVTTYTIGEFTAAIRSELDRLVDRWSVRSYWQREFDLPVVRETWRAVVAEAGTTAEVRR